MVLIVSQLDLQALSKFNYCHIYLDSPRYCIRSCKLNSDLSNNQNPRHSCRGFIAYISGTCPCRLSLKANKGNHLLPRTHKSTRQDFSQHIYLKTCPLGRAVSEDCQPASTALLHPVNPLPSITRSARLIPLPRVARCKSPLGYLLIAHEAWRLSSFSPGKFCELRDFAYGQNLCVLYAKFPPLKVIRLQLVYAPLFPTGEE